MRKKGIPESLVKEVIGLCKGSDTKVKVGTHFSEEFEVNIAVHHISVLSALLFAIAIDVVTNKIKEGMLQEVLCALWLNSVNFFIVGKVHLRVKA